GTVSETPFGPPGSTAGADGTVAGSHVYGDNGSYTVTVTVTDDDGGVGADSFTIEVLNVAPVVLGLLLDSPVIFENESVTLSGSFSDPGTLDVHTVVIDWADGKSDTLVLPLGQRSFSLSHQYVDDPPGLPDDYTIRVTVTDDDAGEDSATTVITVINVDPDLVLSSNGETLQYSDPIQPISITAEDPGIDPLTATTSYSVDGGAFLPGYERRGESGKDPDGLLLMAIGGLIGVHAVLIRLVFGVPLGPRLPRLILTVALVLFGFQLLMFGVLAEMLAKRHYADEKTYRIDRIHGREATDDPPARPEDEIE
ncbi:MAG: hypothetical protein IH933_16010, partial [Euryarchaeota archaeon]|nr:hypothetical protein [Euryarchaeota archaeon]